MSDRRTREGSLNPMWGKQHSQETKNKISLSQKARYDTIRKAIKENISANEATDKKIMRLNTMLESGEISTIGELYRAIHILFLADKINREVSHKLRTLG